jgi:hypothetical protein
LIHEEIKRRLNTDNACYHSVQNLPSSLLLLKSLTIRIQDYILPVVLYGCETWPLILREEHRLRVLENRMLRKVFGSKRDEVMGGWRKLHNEKLQDLYSWPSIIRMINLRMRWARHVARMLVKRNVYMLLVGKPEKERPPARTKKEKIMKFLPSIKCSFLIQNHPHHKVFLHHHIPYTCFNIE